MSGTRIALLLMMVVLPFGLPYFALPTPTPPASESRVVVADSVASDGPPYFDPSLVRPAWLPRMVVPIDGAQVPTNPALLPGAVRGYRGGTHEGVDFSCAPNTPVHAVAAGWVLAVDDAPNLPAVRRDEILALSRQLGRTPAEVLAVLHGKRVIVCHGAPGGRWITTSYSHVGQIRSGLAPGDAIVSGEVIAWTGNSGTSHAYSEGAWGELHFEIRVDGLPLGVGLSPREAGALYAAAFRKAR